MNNINDQFAIAGRMIGRDYPPFVIAELSANHNGKLETAMRIIEEAKKAGADAVKLQTYRADTITLQSDREEFRIHGGLWDGRTLYDLYQEAHMPWEWHAPLFEHAKKNNIIIFSSPFDKTAVDLLEDLNAPAYKVASFELIDLPLIKYIAQTGKPMIISTGMAKAEEIQEALDCARESGCHNIAILRCVSGYPAPASDYNLKTIPAMYERFGVTIGLSDHTLDNTTAIASVALGAAIIEKHFTLDRNGGGPDDSFSLEPHELSLLTSGAKTAWEALGDVNYEPKSSEKDHVKYRRSLYFIKEMKKGDIITEDAIKSVRPGYGLPPKFLPDLLGKAIKENVAANTPVNAEYIDL